MPQQLRRIVYSRLIAVVVGAMALASMCANSDPRLLAGMHDLKILPVATIVDSPETVGLADSNLMRLTTHAEIDKELDMMQSIGVTDIRVGLFWSQIQPFQGVFDWARADYIVNQANSRGMGVLAVLNETPFWAGTPVNSGTPSATDFANFATAIAQRYKGKLSAVEIWNEPNAKFFLNPLSPSNYTGLLKAGYAAIKSVDPSITVIGGVLGAGSTAGTTTMSPQEFLQGMYDAGAHGYFDALSFHPYGNGMQFSEQPNIDLLPKGQLQSLRALMDQYGDDAKQIWATEYGLPTGTASNMVSQQQQADFIADFLNSWGEQAGVGPIFLYTTRDLATGDNSAQDNYGLWETNWTPKLAVKVVKDFIAAHAAPPSGNPIINAIKNAIVKGTQLVGAVVNGVVDFVVGGVKAIAAAVVWVVVAGAKVVVNIAEGIGNLITGAVDRVVGCVEHIFGGAAAVSASTAELSLSSMRVPDTAAPTESSAEIHTRATDNDRKRRDRKLGVAAVAGEVLPSADGKKDRRAGAASKASGQGQNSGGHGQGAKRRHSQARSSR